MTACLANHSIATFECGTHKRIVAAKSRFVATTEAHSSPHQQLSTIPIYVKSTDPVCQFTHIQHKRHSAVNQTPPRFCYRTRPGLRSLSLGRAPEADGSKAWYVTVGEMDLQLSDLVGNICGRRDATGHEVGEEGDSAAT